MVNLQHLATAVTSATVLPNGHAGTNGNSVLDSLDDASSTSGSTAHAQVRQLEFLFHFNPRHTPELDRLMVFLDCLNESFSICHRSSLLSTWEPLTFAEQFMLENEKVYWYLSDKGASPCVSRFVCLVAGLDSTYIV